jgi:hypothetical protein
MTELQRCEKEIREHEANLRAGHPEVAGLFRALLDWRTERRLLMAEKENDHGLPRSEPTTNCSADAEWQPEPASDQSI